MAVEELARVRAEETLRPRPCEKFHRHRVDLAALHAGPDRGIRHTVTVHPRGKRVPRLVRHDLHVVLRAVEVRKNERDFVLAEARAVAAARLAGGREHIHQLVVEHHIEELAGLGRERLVEFFAVRQNRVRVAAGLGVAAAEHKRIVGKVHRILFPEALCLLTVDAVRQRDEVFDHRRAEFFHVVLAVAVAPHAVVAERGVAAVAELFAHRVAQMDHFVVNVVKLRLMLLIPSTFCFPSSEAARVVGVVFERRELRDRVHAALKRDLRAGDQLAVRLREVVFLLALRDDLRREGFARDLSVHEHQIAELRLEVLAERAFQQRAFPGILILFQLRRGSIPERLFRVVKFVARVDRVPHACQRRLRFHADRRCVVLQKDLTGLRIVLRSLQLLRQPAQLFLYRTQIRALIFHLRKFHTKTPLIKLRLTSVVYHTSAPHGSAKIPCSPSAHTKN